jgi:8-oxo-dGTP pyrophosphatase MutT (NUDIX family)
MKLRQAGCLPVRGTGRAVEVLLVTSRYTGEWIMPKGSIEPGETAAVAAAREAAEEAGVRGRIGACLGSFGYLRGHREAVVEAFVLEVHEELGAWPEQSLRRRRWIGLQEALVTVRRVEVRAALEALRRALAMR